MGDPLQRFCNITRRCVEDYNMISPADKIAVGLSGGKDSTALLCILTKLSKFYPNPFEVKAVTIDMGMPGTDFSGLVSLCKALGVEYEIVPTRIKEIVFDVRKETNPCSLCANLRRGALHKAAKQMGCGKVALGHHMDDAVETFVMSLFFEGRISCFTPVTYLDRMDITLIRPLLYLREMEVAALASRIALPVLHNPCPANGNTKRQEVKELIKRLSDEQKLDIRERMFNAMRRYPLDGWRSGEI